MGKIKSYNIEMRPFESYGNLYEIKVSIDDEVQSFQRVAVEPMPFESELEMLNRMGLEIVRKLRDKENHKDCCDCCEKKKKCQKY